MIYSKHSLPEGLPACIAEGDRGLKILQGLFGLSNRKDWQSILHSGTVKSYLQSERLPLRGLSTSQRVARKVLAFYSLPDARWEGWALYCALDPASSPVSEEDLVPSLEYAALQRYDPGFFDYEIDCNLLEQSLDGIIGFRYSGRLPQFEEPALSVWPALREDLLRWSAIPSDRQEAVVLATFAVATILDDVRIVEWAAGRNARLAEEFAFAVDASPERLSELVDSVPIYALAAPPDPEPVLGEWNRTCDLIIEIATDLQSSSPEHQRLGDLLEPVERLEALREQIRAAIDIRNRKALISRVADILTACAEDFDAPWLGGIRGRVHALWQLEYCVPSAIPADEAQRDLDRMQDELTREVPGWRKFEDTKANHRKELSDLQDSTGSDLEGQLEAEAREERLHARMAEAARQATSCKRRILEAIAPAGRKFDPSKDYEAELEGAELAGAMATPASIETAATSGSDRPDASEDRGPENPGPGGDPPPAGGLGGGDQASSREKEAGLPRETTAVPSAAAATDGCLEDSVASGLAQLQGEKAVDALAAEKAGRNACDVVVKDRYWTGGWEAWLERIGDSTHPDSVKSWNPEDVPNCPPTSPFEDPFGFAESLSRKLTCGMAESPRDTLLALVHYLNSDPLKGRQEWKAIYRAILNYCLREKLEAKDSQPTVVAVISLILKTNPSNDEYMHLVDSADRLTALPPEFPNVKWALELSVPFLNNHCANREYLAIYFDTIYHYVSTSGFHFASKHQAMWDEIRKFLDVSRDDAGRAAPATESAQELQKLSSFLKGKRVVIYTLQRSAALTARDRIQAIESSTEIRLLHDKVWSDSLQDPIRNADLCVMVKSAAKHSLTEMISRTRRNAGKELIVPPWKGVHSLLRAIYDAAGLGDDSALASGMNRAGGAA